MRESVSQRGSDNPRGSFPIWHRARVDLGMELIKTEFGIKKILNKMDPDDWIEVQEERKETKYFSSKLLEANAFPPRYVLLRLGAMRRPTPPQRDFVETHSAALSLYTRYSLELTDMPVNFSKPPWGARVFESGRLIFPDPSERTLPTDSS